MTPLALVAKLTTRWRHLHCFQSWPTDCITCIATLLYWRYQLVLSWYPHQPESHQLSLQKVSQWRTTGPNYRTPGLPGSDKNIPVKFSTMVHRWVSTWGNYDQTQSADDWASAYETIGIGREIKCTNWSDLSYIYLHMLLNLYIWSRTGTESLFL